MGLTDDVSLKYTVTIREISTTVEKGQVTLVDGHSPHPCTRSPGAAHQFQSVGNYDSTLLTKPDVALRTMTWTSTALVQELGEKEPAGSLSLSLSLLSLFFFMTS